MQVAVQPAETATAMNDAADEPTARVSEVGAFDALSAVEPALSYRGFAGRAALKAGVLGAVVGFLNVPLGAVVAGALAVFFYRRGKGFTPAVRIGSRLGGAAGIVSFTIDYLLVVVAVFATHGQQQYIDRLLKFYQSLGYSPTDPQIQASVRLVFTPSGLLLGFALGVILAVVLAALGGGVAAHFSRSSSRR